MNMVTLYQLLTVALADSNTVRGWAVQHYGTPAKIYEGYDVDNPPGESECPFVAIYPVSRATGQAQEYKRHSFMVECAVLDTEGPQAVDHSPAIVRFNGGSRAMELLKLSETVLAGAAHGGILESVDAVFETIELFPLIVAAMTVTIRETITIGMDPLL
jgi:hypothetical protein